MSQVSGLWTFEDYAAVKAINATALKAGMRSMLHMREIMEGDNSESSPAMRWGSLSHKAILERGEFAGIVNVFDGDKRSKEWKEYKAGHDTEWTVTSKEARMLEDMRDSVHDNPDASRLIDAVDKELSFKWNDPDYGSGKARLDGYHPDIGIIELKTARDISPRSFGQACASMFYDIQLGWYAEAVMQTSGVTTIPKIHIIAVENHAPWDCAVYSVPELVVQMGRTRARKKAIEYRYACESIRFPGQVDGIKPLEMPSWWCDDDSVLINGLMSDEE